MTGKDVCAASRDRVDVRLDSQPGRWTLPILIVVALLAAVSGNWALAAEKESLKQVPLPRTSGLNEFLRTDGKGEVSADAKSAAIKLGKALFWDIQVGSDGRTACATCHHYAGADARVANSVHPGPNKEFDVTNSGPGENLVFEDFPFHRLANPTHRFSPVLSSIDDTTGSQGVRSRKFSRVLPFPSIDGDPSIDEGFATPVEYFGIEYRQVSSRNAPSVINAAYNKRNSWTGRASDVFNGCNPEGPDAAIDRPILVVDTGHLLVKRVHLDNSSLASHAVGPPVDPRNMSWAGRTFQDIGQKMLSLQPLQKQRVHRDDGVLGDCVLTTGRELTAAGLNVDYEDLIKAAFQPRYWDYYDVGGEALRLFADENGELDPNARKKYSLMAWNFSLFWGIAIQCYERTLISDDTPFDRWVQGDTKAMSHTQQRGMTHFFGDAGCARCHGGAEFTLASVSAADRGENGFRNLGIRPVSDDVGRAQGRFKIPGLRNVELTAPYFHNGSVATLQQVVEAYVRGIRNYDAEAVDVDLKLSLKKLRDKPSRISDLVRFLRALTDDRVRYSRAPFDHPSLPLPGGDNLQAVGGDG